MSLCSWNDSLGTSCKWPAPFCADTHGGGRYFCVWHWRAFGLDRLEMKAEGDRAVRESLEWDGTPESYLALRLASQVRKAEKPGISGEAARVSEAKGSLHRNDAHGVSRMDGVPKKLSELVPDLQP